MSFIINIAIRLAVYAGLLFILKQVFKDFKLKNNSIIIVAAILMGLDLLLGTFLRTILKPIIWISFYILAPFVYFAVNLIVLKVTDAISDALEIKSFTTLIFSTIALAIAHSVMNLLIR